MAEDRAVGEADLEKTPPPRTPSNKDRCMRLEQQACNNSFPPTRYLLLSALSFLPSANCSLLLGICSLSLTPFILALPAPTSPARHDFNRDQGPETLHFRSNLGSERANCTPTPSAASIEYRSVSHNI